MMCAEQSAGTLGGAAGPLNLSMVFSHHVALPSNLCPMEEIAIIAISWNRIDGQMQSAGAQFWRTRMSRHETYVERHKFRLQHSSRQRCGTAPGFPSAARY